MLARYPQEEFGPVDRLAQQRSLILVAAPILEKGQLLGILHAVGNHGESKTVGHGNERSDDGGVVGIVGNVVEERSIDLEVVERKALQIADGRVTRTEVPDGDLHTHLLDALHCAQISHGIVDEDTLGELQAEKLA